MKLSSLTLEKYGAFTGRHLSFRADARAHIVFGPNEAGKSTALSAVRDLLFGDIGMQYAFAHKGPELRLGGELLARDGRRIQFVRRKGNKSTLLDASGKALPDDALAPFLGGLTRDVFSRAFGLDARALRAGADDILRSRGDAGESLMAAASGLRGLSDLRRMLDEEADGIFAPNGRNRALNKARDRVDAARKSITESELLATPWRRLEDEISARQGRLEEIKSARKELTTRLSRVNRLKKLKPLVIAIDLAERALAAMGETNGLRRGFGDELGAALAALSDAEKQHAEAATKSREAADELAAIHVDRALIEHGADIAGLVTRVGDYRKATPDRAKQQALADDRHRDARELATKLGLANVEDIEASQPSAALLADIAILIRDGERLNDEGRALEENFAREASVLSRLERENAAAGFPIEPAPLREKLLAFGDIGDRARERDREIARIVGEQKALADEAARMSPPIKNLDKLARATLPKPEAIQQFRNDFQKVDVAESSARDALATARHELSSAESALAVLVAGRPVPTQELITTTRAARDAEWRPLRASLFGESGALAGVALAGAAARFEIAAAEADHLADEAVRDADRVSGHRARGAEVARARVRVADAEARIAKASEWRTDIAARWSQTWAPAHVEPATPEEMSAWLNALRALLARRAKVESDQVALDVASSRLAQLVPALDALTAEMGLSPLPGLDIGRIAARLGDRLKELEARWAAARDMATRRDIALVNKADFASKIATLAMRREDWTKRWHAVAPVLRVNVEVSREAAAAALEAWKSAPALLRERDSHVSRVDGMKRDMNQFEGDVASLVEVLAPDLASMAAPDAAETLAKRHGDASLLDARREQIARQKTSLDTDLEIAATALATAKAALDKLAAMAPAGADLAELRRDIDARDRAVEALDKARRDFLLVADGVDENSARADLADFDIDRANAEAEALSREDATLESESNDCHANLARLKDRREQLEKGAGAEAAHQQRSGAEAEMRQLAREWAVLKIGGLMLQTTLERQRAERADPLLARASDVFSTLTGKAFTGIAQEYDDDDVARLVARRANGDIVRVGRRADADAKGKADSDAGGLSEGTADQLYLALRLAYIEDYATRSEPAPFVVDDIFASFDDSRTRFALQALGDFGKFAQPIVFTHHGHVVDLARAVLGDGADVIDLG